MTEAQFDLSHPEGWPGVDREAVKFRVVHRQIIDSLVRDVLKESEHRASEIKTLRDARAREMPVVQFSAKREEQVGALIEFMFNFVYKSPLVVRQNARADMVLRRLFGVLNSDTRLLPRYVQERIRQDGTRTPIHVAHFLAGLSDRGAVDLYAELFEPGERAMGRHVH